MVMSAIIEHGTPHVDDPHSIGAVGELGIDETSFLPATPTHPDAVRDRPIDLERPRHGHG